MNDKAKIAALRAALTECRNYLSDFYANAKVRGAEAAHRRAFEMQQLADRALTADDAEQEPCQTMMIGGAPNMYGRCDPAPIAAEPAPKPWEDRMAAHYGQTDKGIKCYGTAHFMQQEIDEWRKK